LRYFDPETQESYVPYVVETSIGLDRMFLATLSAALQEETLEDGSQRTVLRIPAPLAPVKAAVLPLLKKDGLPEKAREILKMLQLENNVQYDEKDAIGRRYRRQDAIGTPIVHHRGPRHPHGPSRDHSRPRHHGPRTHSYC
jgi:glycyl-tRNA synthetase